jgi:hypothetical protein
MVNHIQDQLLSFTSTYETSFTKASAQLQSIIDKFSYFKGTQDQYMQTYGTQCAQTCAFNETSFTSFCNNLKAQITQTLESDIKTRLQNAIESHIQPHFDKHLEELGDLATNLMLNIKILQQDCITT